MNPLILHLKYEYWNMVCQGNKTHEYREYKPYWIKRIKEQKELILVPGYANCNSLDIHAKIKNISVIDYNDLPEYAKDEFENSEQHHFFDIEFEIK